MKSRRSFIIKSTLGAAALTFPGMFASAETTTQNMPKISLAQWSLNRAFFSKKLDPINFAGIAKKSYGISAIEYVNQFYTDQASDEKFWNDMARRATDAEVLSLIMMVDEKEKLGDSNANTRNTAIESHYKWVNAAKILGCHSIRVNAFGDGSPDLLEASLVEGLGKLTAYAAKEKVHVILENHGLHTSNADFMVGIIKAVNNPFLGTLPDFGNWCLNAAWGSTQKTKNCTNIFPPEEGIAKFLPYAKGVSAKSYAFDADGFDTVIDYPKLLQLVKNSNYNGHIGIEYEGEKLSEPDGIKATKAVIEKVWKSLD